MPSHRGAAQVSGHRTSPRRSELRPEVLCLYKSISWLYLCTAHEIFSELSCVAVTFHLTTPRSSASSISFVAPGDVFKLLRQYPDTHMVATPVSKRVNTPKNNDAELIAPAMVA